MELGHASDSAARCRGVQLPSSREAPLPSRHPSACSIGITRQAGLEQMSRNGEHAGPRRIHGVGSREAAWSACAGLLPSGNWRRPARYRNPARHARSEATTPRSPALGDVAVGVLRPGLTSTKRAPQSCASSPSGFLPARSTKSLGAQLLGPLGIRVTLPSTANSPGTTQRVKRRAAGAGGPPRKSPRLELRRGRGVQVHKDLALHPEASPAADVDGGPMGGIHDDAGAAGATAMKLRHGCPLLTSGLQGSDAVIGVRWSASSRWCRGRSGCTRPPAFRCRREGRT